MWVKEMSERDKVAHSIVARLEGTGMNRWKALHIGYNILRDVESSGYKRAV